MSNVAINSIEIKSFRNLKNTRFQLNGKNTAFSGCNALGKTNLLNAIYWCLTGSDLFGNCSDALNVPHDFDYMDGVPAVDVSVNLSVGSVRRTATFVNGSLTEALYINGLTTTLKKDEVALDSMLGILPLVIANKSKKFNVRKFLLNPLYIKTVAPIEFRRFVLGLVGDAVKPSAIFESLNDSVKERLHSYDATNTYDAEIMSNNIKAKKKSAEKIANDDKVIYAWLEENHPELVNDKAKVLSQLSKANDDLMKVDSDSVMLDSYVRCLDLAYDSFLKDYLGNIRLVLLEKGAGDDVYKSVCYPLIPNTTTPFECGSTSEQIRLGCALNVAIAKNCEKVSILPLLFDECETLDYRSLGLLSARCDTQLISACVVADSDIIVARGF